MRLYANRTSESGAGSGVPPPSKMSACHSHAEVTHAFTYDDVNSRRPFTRLLSVALSPLFAANLIPMAAVPPLVPLGAYFQFRDGLAPSAETHRNSDAALTYNTPHAEVIRHFHSFRIALVYFNYCRPYRENV